MRTYTASSGKVDLDYGDLNLNSDAVRITTGSTTVDLFADPEYFPIKLDGEYINLSVEYGSDTEKFTVERLRSTPHTVYVTKKPVEKASMETYGMTEYQQTIAFLYLIGRVMP